MTTIFQAKGKINWLDILFMMLGYLGIVAFCYLFMFSTEAFRHSSHIASAWLASVLLLLMIWTMLKKQIILKITSNEENTELSFLQQKLLNGTLEIVLKSGSFKYRLVGNTQIQFKTKDLHFRISASDKFRNKEMIEQVFKELTSRYPSEVDAPA